MEAFRTVPRRTKWVRRTVAAFATIGVLTTGIIGYTKIWKPIETVAESTNVHDVREALTELSEDSFLTRQIKHRMRMAIMKTVLEYDKRRELFIKAVSGNDEVRRVFFASAYLSCERDVLQNFFKTFPEELEFFEKGVQSDDPIIYSSMANFVKIMMIAFSINREARLAALDKMSWGTNKENWEIITRIVRLIDQELLENQKTTADQEFSKKLLRVFKKRVGEIEAASFESPQSETDDQFPCE